MKKNCANCALYSLDSKLCVDDTSHESDDTCPNFISTEALRVGAIMPEYDLTLRQVKDWCDRHNYVLVTKEFAESRGF